MHLRRVALVCCVALYALSAVSHAAVERRRDQFGTDFAYYVYPIVGDIPGIGRAAGAGASVLNVGDNDSDVSAYYIGGDFEAKGIALLDYHLSPKKLILDVGYNDYLVAPTSYDRGIDSDPNDVIHPKVNGNYFLGQLTYTHDERRYEVFLRALNGRNRLLEILDKDGKAYSGIDDTWKHSVDYALGGSIDLTDDRLDPRVGGRLEFAAKLPRDVANDESRFWVTDYNLSYFVPMRQWDTLAFNVFHSRTYVTRQGVTDIATLQQTHGLDCNQYVDAGERSDCLTTEQKRLAALAAQNRYGTATPLGGTQRLRAFDNYRFYASQALFYGAEYRWNLTDERTPFDIFIAKGIRTGIQFAAFWEHGTVTDDSSELWRGGRSSYGVGARVILSGVIIRFDLAHGSDGAQSQLFITYPWSMFSVDNPG